MLGDCPGGFGIDWYVTAELLAGVRKQVQRGKVWNKAKQQQRCNLLGALAFDMKSSSPTQMSKRVRVDQDCDVPFITVDKDSVFCPKCGFPFFCSTFLFNFVFETLVFLRRV